MDQRRRVRTCCGSLVTLSNDEMHVFIACVLCNAEFGVLVWRAGCSVYTAKAAETTFRLHSESKYSPYTAPRYLLQTVLRIWSCGYRLVVSANFCRYMAYFDKIEIIGPYATFSLPTYIKCHCVDVRWCADGTMCMGVVTMCMCMGVTMYMIRCVWALVW